MTTAKTLEAKRVLVTGANGGLGLATSRAILEEGGTVVFACRSMAKAQAAAEAARQGTDLAPDRTVAAGGFDMLDPAAIDSAVEALPPELIDVVFLQAGGWVWADELQTVAVGGVPVEATVAKNVVGAHATLRALLQSDRLSAGARVVIVGGEGARGVPGAIARPSFLDARQFEAYLGGKPAGPYVPIDALGVAKLCAGLWALQAAEAFDATELSVLSFTPGLIGGTGGTAGMPAWKEALFQRVAFPLMVALGRAQWPAAAAAKCVDALSGRVGQHGDVLGAPEGKTLGPITDQVPMQPAFGDPAFRTSVWRLCEAAVGPLSLPPRGTAAAS